MARGQACVVSGIQEPPKPLAASLGRWGFDDRRDQNIGCPKYKRFHSGPIKMEKNGKVFPAASPIFR